ncbi:MAG TPA: uroporphyrinogen-III synthase [Bosea sp. (in: a-proteobacteria)]|jgi:uroporphyrinogen-III synthase|uniref:uroporphyrinogen-III synthase n=1 Tax=Bosea sp. (in: a-proteobacteria) TaxID=1871050 RepID=UPI002E0E2889|nr:uroporphyrinogen-III synthase [Bosea sp. (in: a-proteobacteria)]
MRIFVFRPPADAERTATAIRAHGHEPVLAPLFAVARLPAPAPEGPFAAIALTSGNAVPALADLLPVWRDLPVFAVGARTAGKVREAGFEDARSANGNRDDMVALIRDNLKAPARLLLIVGRDRHEDVADKLAAAGFEVVTWVAYAAEAIAAFPEQAREVLRQGGVDGALHYSARGVRTCLELARAAGVVDPLLDLTHVALSADVAAPLISAGASTVLVAEHPEEAALLAALDQVSARNRAGGDVTEETVAPSGVETDKDAMNDPETPSGSADAKPGPGDKPGSKARSRSGRTPPTIELTAQVEAETRPEVKPEPETAASPAVADVAPEAALPTEALPQEFSGTTGRNAPDDEPAVAASLPPEPARSRLPALALAGFVGGVVGAGLVMLALGRTTPAVTAEQVAALQSRLDALQSGAAELERKAAAASDAAAKAGAAAQAATARASEVAAAQAPDAAAIASLNTQAQRAEAAASTARQMLEQASARIGNVETLAKAAAAPSPQALAAARIVLAERVQSALASGQPFAGDVAALAKGGGSPEQLAALNAVAASGAPTKEALLTQLRGHRAMFARELMPASAGWQDRLLGLASRIVSIRPVGDTGANDPATLPMRLDNALAKGDVVAAAALWAQLPEPARRASADFGSALQKRAAADAAIAKIAQDAVAALGVAG